MFIKPITCHKKDLSVALDDVYLSQQLINALTQCRLYNAYIKNHDILIGLPSKKLQLKLIVQITL